MDIKLNHICKSFDGRILFDDICLILPEGRITFVTGPSGCGKTTLFNLLMGIESPDSGEISGIDGLNISAVFQEDRLCENISALSNAAIALGNGKTWADARKTLENLGLSEAINQPVRTLSGGMKRRVALARALLADYDILLLDEPFTGLDGDSRNRAVECILASLGGRTAIIISHDPDFPAVPEGKILNLQEFIKNHKC